VIPSSAPNPLPGDLDRDAHVTPADITATMRALADLDNYQATNNLSDPDLKTIADLNLDGTIDNLDVQALIVGLANGSLAGGGSFSTTAVPEPPAIASAASALLALGAISYARRMRPARPAAGWPTNGLKSLENFKGRRFSFVNQGTAPR
jgi:hypothetical protein